MSLALAPTLADDAGRYRHPGRPPKSPARGKKGAAGRPGAWALARRLRNQAAGPRTRPGPADPSYPGPRAAERHGPCQRPGALKEMGWADRARARAPGGVRRQWRVACGGRENAVRKSARHPILYPVRMLPNLVAGFQAFGSRQWPHASPIETCRSPCASALSFGLGRRNT